MRDTTEDANEDAKEDDRSKRWVRDPENLFPLYTRSANEMQVREEWEGKERVKQVKNKWE